MVDWQLERCQFIAWALPWCPCSIAMVTISFLAAMSHLAVVVSLINIELSSSFSDRLVSESYRSGQTQPRSFDRKVWGRAPELFDRRF